MSSTALGAIASQYAERYPEVLNDQPTKLHDLARGFARDRAAALAEALAVAAAVDQFLERGVLDLSELSPQMQEAFQAQYPNIDLSGLDGERFAELAGYMNGWIGKLFEVLIRDELNAGERVGHWQLEPGQTAVLAEKANQPGWDLEIQDADGQMVDVLQLKATASASYVNAALERYPDIPVVATEDVARSFKDASDVSTADYSTEELRNQIVGGDDATSIVGGAGDFAMPASVIFVTEALAVATRTKSADQALESAGERLIDSAIAGAIGALIGTMTFGLGGALAAFGTRYYLSRLRRSEAAATPAAEPAREALPAPVAHTAHTPTDKLELRPRLLTVSEFAKSLAYLHGVYSPEQTEKQSAIAVVVIGSTGSSMAWEAWKMRKTGEVFLICQAVQREDSSFVWAYLTNQKRLIPYPKARINTMALRVADSLARDSVEIFWSWWKEHEAAFRAHRDDAVARRTRSPLAYPSSRAV